MTHIPFLSIYIRGIKTCPQKDWNKCSHSLTRQDGRADVHQHHRAAMMDTNSGMSLSHGADHCHEQCGVAGRQNVACVRALPGDNCKPNHRHTGHGTSPWAVR